MAFVVVLEPMRRKRKRSCESFSRQLRDEFENCFGVWQRVHVNIIPLEGFDEGFRHPVTLRAFDRCEAGFEIELPGKDDCFLGRISRSIISEHLDRLRSA